MLSLPVILHFSVPMLSRSNEEKDKNRWAAMNKSQKYA